MDKCNQCDSTSSNAGTLRKHDEEDIAITARAAFGVIEERERAGGCHQSISGHHGNQRKAEAPNPNKQFNKGNGHSGLFTFTF